MYTDLVGEKESVSKLECVELLGNKAAEGGTDDGVRAGGKLVETGDKEVNVAGLIVLLTIIAN